VPVYPAQGKILFKGQPVPNAIVSLHANTEELKELHPNGVTGEDGVFTLTTYKKDDGAPAGDYKVTIFAKSRGEHPEDDGADVIVRNLLPPKFLNPDTSGIAVSIAPGDNEIPDIELSK